MIATCTNCTISSIIINQCSGKECILSEAIVNMVWIYNYISGNNVDKDVYKRLDEMGEERGN